MTNKNRSSRLKKIGIVFEEFINDNIVYKPTKDKQKAKVKAKEKGLSDYQQFLKSELKKEKYKNITPSKRFSIIGKLWKDKTN